MDSYDFIIVGGGTSGSVLASRLATTLTNHKILLLEAGGKNDDINHQVLGERFATWMTAPGYNWGYKTVPQQHMGNRVIDYSRGKGLGGSTSINFGIWTRGPSQDYDLWARLVDDETWSWENVTNRYKKLETYQEPLPEFKKYVDPSPSVHGHNGPVNVGFANVWERGFTNFLDTVHASGRPKNLDVNSGNPIGFAITAISGSKGRRTTASDAYLASPPSNLTIMTNQVVERVLFDGKKAVGIQASGRKIFATKEVVLAAGAIDSPKLLLLSGIGPSEELAKLGIKSIENLQGVGKGLRDHLFTTLTIVKKLGSTDRPAFYNDPEAVKRAREQWLKDQTGPFTVFQCAHGISFMKIDRVLQSKEFGELDEEVQRHLLEETIPSCEMITHIFPSPKVPSSQDSTSFCIAFMNTQAVGELILRSTDPNEPAIIDPKFLSHPFDRRVAIETIRDALELLDEPALAEDNVSFAEWPKGRSDEELYEYVKENGISMWHMCGTVKMGKPGEPTTCVDKDFRVAGVESLRVVDMSIAPLMLNAHTQAAAFLIGETAAEKMIAEYS